MSIIETVEILDLSKLFLNDSIKVKDLPHKKMLCLGSLRTQKDMAVMHLRQHDFLKHVIFTANLGKILEQCVTTDVEFEIMVKSTILYAFLECIREYIHKNTILWKIIDPIDEIFEIYI